MCVPEETTTNHFQTSDLTTDNNKTFLTYCLDYLPERVLPEPNKDKSEICWYWIFYRNIPLWFSITIFQRYRQNNIIQSNQIVTENTQISADHDGQFQKIFLEPGSPPYPGPRFERHQQ